MLDKEKPWLLFKVNVGGIPDADVPCYMESVIKAIDADDSVKVFVMPIREGESGGYLLYSPNGDNDEQLRLARKFMDKINGVSSDTDQDVITNNIIL